MKWNAVSRVVRCARPYNPPPQAMLLPEALPLTSQAVLAATPAPPRAARRPKAMTKFGDRRVDPYAWLRDKASPEVIDYLHPDNPYPEGPIKPLASFPAPLYSHMLAP